MPVDSQTTTQLCHSRFDLSQVGQRPAPNTRRPSLNEGEAVLRLEYEVYEPLAVKEGERILAEAVERFGVSRACGIHRSGLLELGDVAVVVAVSSPHRDAAFRACRYIIDEVKARLPIWKKEYYANGQAEWVNCKHCGHAL